MSNELNQPPRQTLVDSGTTLKGGIVSTCPVLVNGSVHGDLEVPELTVSGSGTVQGTVKADTVRSEGTIGGELTAKRIQLSGVVLPNTVLVADELDIQLGGGESKSLQLTFGEEAAPSAGSRSATNGASTPPKSRQNTGNRPQP